MSFMVEAFTKIDRHHIELKARQHGNLFRGVQWVNIPQFAQEAKNTPAQLAGLRYEKRVEQKLSILAKPLGFELIAHRWISYNNKFFAQPDFVLVSPSGATILAEAKYTYTNTLSQREFYTGLLEKLGLKPITSITICHNLTRETLRDKIIHDFYDLEQDSIWQLRI